MKKKVVKTRPVGRPEGSLKEGSQDAQIAFRLNAVDKDEWIAAADKKSVRLSVWMRATLNAAAKRINR